MFLEMWPNGVWFVNMENGGRHTTVDMFIATTCNVSLARIPAVMSASSTPNRATPGKLATNAMGM